MEVQRRGSEERQHQPLADRANQHEDHRLRKQKIHRAARDRQPDARRAHHAQARRFVAVMRQSENGRGVGEQPRIRGGRDEEGGVQHGERADKENPRAGRAERLPVHLAQRLDQLAIGHLQALAVQYSRAEYVERNRRAGVNQHRERGVGVQHAQPSEHATAPIGRVVSGADVPRIAFLQAPVRVVDQFGCPDAGDAERRKGDGERRGQLKFQPV